MPHIHEKYDFTTSIFIVHGGAVLFVDHPRYGKWLPIGGHVELDEDPEQTLLREIAEETGLTDITVLGDKPSFPDDPICKPLYAPRYLDVHEANPPHKHIGLIYFVTSKGGAAVLSAEHTAMAWLKPEQFDDPAYNLPSSVKFYAKQALAAAAAA